MQLNRTELKQFCRIFFNYTFTFYKIAVKSCTQKSKNCKKLQYKIPGKQLETLDYIYIEYLGSCRKLQKKLQKLALIIRLIRERC